MDTRIYRKYGSISLPKQLIHEVKRILERRQDYASVSDFVKDAVRRRLEEIEKEERLKRLGKKLIEIDADGDVEVWKEVNEK